MGRGWVGVVQAVSRQHQPVCHPSGGRTCGEGQPSPPAPGGLSSCQDHLNPVIRDQHKLLRHLALGHCCGVAVGSSSDRGHAAWPGRGQELGSEGNSLTPFTILCQHDRKSSGWRPVGPSQAPVLTPGLVTSASPAVTDGGVGSDG